MVAVGCVDFESKFCEPVDILDRLPSLPQPVVLTNGCFDLLHRGHVTYLAQAKEKGRSLIVAVNTDASVRRQNKGKDRPINTLRNRMSMLAALESVDVVTWFDEDTPMNLIELIRPDVLVKGGDWAIDDIVGAKETLVRGGKVYSIPFIHSISTTQLIEKIRGG